MDIIIPREARKIAPSRATCAGVPDTDVCVAIAGTARVSVQISRTGLASNELFCVCVACDHGRAYTDVHSSTAALFVRVDTFGFTPPEGIGARSSLCCQGDRPYLL